MMRVKAIITGGEIRRFSLTEKERTFCALEGKLKALFSLPEEASLQVSYYDEEGDQVVFSTDDEMATFSLDQVLKLYVKVAPIPTPAPAPTQSQAQTPTTQTQAQAQAPPTIQIPLTPGLLPPQSGIIFSTSPSSAPPPYRSAPPSPRASPIIISGYTNAARILIPLVLLAFMIAFSLVALHPHRKGDHHFHHHRHPHHHAHHPHHHPEQEASDPHEQMRQMFFQHAGATLFIAFFLSVILAAIVAFMVTWYFSKTINAFATVYQHPQLYQQRVNEFWAAFHQLVHAFTHPEHLHQEQNQNQSRQSRQTTQSTQNQQPNAPSAPLSQENQNTASQAQFHPPPYEGIRHRSSVH